MLALIVKYFTKHALICCDQQSHLNSLKINMNCLDLYGLKMMRWDTPENQITLYFNFILHRYYTSKNWSNFEISFFSSFSPVLPSFLLHWGPRKKVCIVPDKSQVSGQKSENIGSLTAHAKLDLRKLCRDQQNCKIMWPKLDPFQFHKLTTVP